MIYFLQILFLFFTARGIFGLNEACIKNSDCGTTNARCINELCVCDSLSYEKDGHCLTYGTEYKSLCSETKQCEWLGENAECRNGRCICQDKYRWYKGKCQAFVDKGETCSSSDDCYNGYDLLSLNCTSGTCTCSSKYYDRGGDCRVSASLTADCAINYDCKKILIDLICSVGKCVLKSSSKSENVGSILKLLSQPGVEEISERFETPVSKGTILAETISCDDDNDCADMANSICNSNGTCECTADNSYLSNGNCVPGFSVCTADADCTTSNTLCFKNTCICQQGYFLKNGVCIAELGVVDPNTNYKKDSDCPIKPGKLLDKACFCKNYWFNDDANRECTKTMIQQTRSCLNNDWCYAMGPYAFCNSTTSQCQCSSIAKLNEETYYCEMQSEITTGMCLEDEECLMNERCLDEKCQCSENFARGDDNVCKPNVGGSCITSSCFHIANSICKQGVCTCSSDYIGKGAQCLKVAENLNDSCEQDEQCKNISNAVCGDQQLCTCQKGYTDVDTKCYQVKKYGDPCLTELDCTRTLNHSYQCRNSVCQCPVGYKLRNLYCTSSGNISLISYTALLLFLTKLVVSQ